MIKNRGNLPVAHLYSLINHIQQHPSDSVAERTQVFEFFKGLVYSRVRKFCYPDSANFEDCLQEAYVGLARAIERFDASRGIQFSTLATTIIDHRIIDLLESERRLYDGPLGRRVTVGECDEDGNVVELDDLATIKSFETASIWSVDLGRLRLQLLSSVANLPERQQEAIKLFYGSDLPKAAIAASMKISRPRVNALLDDAVEGLRRRMRIGS